MATAVLCSCSSSHNLAPTCECRLVPDSEFSSFFGPSQLAGEDVDVPHTTPGCHAARARYSNVHKLVQHCASTPLAGHYSRLHDVLRRLSDAEVPGHLAELLPPSLPSATAPPHAPARPPRRGLLLQDISSGNLLLKKNVGDGCMLLFSDPSRAELMDNLDSPDAYAACPHVDDCCCCCCLCLNCCCINLHRGHPPALCDGG